jgi:hypothetical protein
MKSCLYRIEVGPVGPDQCVSLRVNGYPIEKLKVMERSVQLARQDRKEVDCLPSAVVKLNANGIRSDDFKACDTTKQMLHA